MDVLPICTFLMMASLFATAAFNTITLPSVFGLWHLVQFILNMSSPLAVAAGV